jgi:PRC-barrel domain
LNSLAFGLLIVKSKEKFYKEAIMLRSVNDLKGYTIHATDGDVGEVVEFYFDDEEWTIRYVVADTGNWLTGRKVLISPVALGRVDWNSKKLNAAMTREQVQNSPDIDTDKPVSRQHETAYYDYYGYPYYWAGPYLWGPVPYPADYPAYAGSTPSSVEREVAAAEKQQGDVHLRSTNEVTGYYIGASDGDIGHVEDFLIDDENWTIRYMVVDTRNWWPGKKVLVAPDWIKSISWADSKVYVDLSRDSIKNGPEYNPSVPMDRDYEGRLYQHYGRPKYWSH